MKLSQDHSKSRSGSSSGTRKSVSGSGSGKKPRSSHVVRVHQRVEVESTKDGMSPTLKWGLYILGALLLLAAIWGISRLFTGESKGTVSLVLGNSKDRSGRWSPTASGRSPGRGRFYGIQQAIAFKAAPKTFNYHDVNSSDFGSATNAYTSGMNTIGEFHFHLHLLGLHLAETATEWELHSDWEKIDHGQGNFQYRHKSGDWALWNRPPASGPSEGGRAKCTKTLTNCEGHKRQIIEKLRGEKRFSYYQYTQFGKHIDVLTCHNRGFLDRLGCATFLSWQRLRPNEQRELTL